MLNPQLDRAALAAEFKADDRILIRDVLVPEVAERLATQCHQQVPFEYAYVMDGKATVSTREELQAWDAAKTAEFQRKLFETAGGDGGFFYCNYMMRRAEANKENPALQLVHDSFLFLNSPELLQFIREVSGCQDVQSAEAQFTRFAPGQFQTRHRDDVPGRERRLVYSLDLTPQWRPDWGGLLQFYRDDGAPREAWTPGFNTLALFDVRHVHAVTYVTPFARRARLALSGWFRATPPA